MRPSSVKDCRSSVSIWDRPGSRSSLKAGLATEEGGRGGPCLPCAGQDIDRDE